VSHEASLLLILATAEEFGYRIQKSNIHRIAYLLSKVNPSVSPYTFVADYKAPHSTELASIFEDYVRCGVILSDYDSGGVRYIVKNRWENYVDSLPSMNDRQVVRDLFAEISTWSEEQLIAATSLVGSRRAE
jgi:hypothetical protein